jgi:hypothetical protein
MNKVSSYSRACADRWALMVVVTVVAALAIVSGHRLSAQDQPQQKHNLPTKTDTAKYNFLIASGFLCDPNYSDSCAAVARTGDGETIEISGAGTLDAGKSVTAAGAFTEKKPTGDIAVTGVWAATGLVSFESYGIAPWALLLDYPQLRARGPFPMGKGMMPGLMGGGMAGPVAAGGLAVIRIRLLPDAGSPRDALLRVNCAKGRVPEDEPNDGVRLTITDGGPVFDEQVSGRTAFLLQRPMANLAWSKRPSTQGQ